MEPETINFLKITLKGGYVCHAVSVVDFETAVRLSLALKASGHKVELINGRRSYHEHEIDLSQASKYLPQRKHFDLEA